MIIRLEQFLGQWVNLIDLPVDDYDLTGIRQVVSSLSENLRHNGPTELTNSEADFTVLVNPLHGPIQLRIMEPDPVTHTYADL